MKVYMFICTYSLNIPSNSKISSGSKRFICFFLEIENWLQRSKFCQFLVPFYEEHRGISNNEFIRSFHKFFPPSFLSLSSWKRKRKSYYLFQNIFFSQFDSWKRNHNKYSIKNCRFGVQDWRNYLMNSLKVLFIMK